MCDRGETCQQGSSGGGLCASTNVDVGPEVEPANTMPSSSPRASDELPPDQDSSETPVTPPSTESPSPTPADSRPNPDSRPDPDSNPDLVPAGNPVTPQTSQSPPALPTPNTATRSPSPSVGSNIGTDQSSGDCSDNGDCNISQECREDSVGIGRCVRREENICISVHHLSHLHGDDLRYSTHRLARVLCDKHNSCATAGHIVIYEAVPMMMSSYCKTVRCVQKIMHVNSVRYKRRSVVQSNSKGLTFTAFAARYNTVLEEKLLGMAIRLGL
ncbi:hypothetical protein BWQ96_09585 [Gracilariopsis chorda]|uniref:Uncharacterized protein n=1 Tax=Gracilariopsis chorda TaxID=448386 RepID=A0A2V3IF61_9FLOR|nr:hypothetical protein BWQ96_09585 [Gracilariopsis chorda]|eukprot:PXF40707.1 hypothetical protein BWQ96_09585 [Gracilariopsis chorda]